MDKRKRKESIKTKKKGKVLGTILFILVFGSIGFFMGYLSETYFEGQNPIGELSNIYILVLMTFVVYISHIIIHEAGHLVFGLMTGYSFISFRIGSFTIVKEDNKLKIKRFNIPGTAGQCLMMPPEMIEGEFPFIIYNLGGALANLIISFIGILALIYIKGISSSLYAILFLSSSIGIITGLTNVIPMKISGVSNDGYNILSMIRDEEAKRGFYVQLKVNGLLTKGIRAKDMSVETFQLKEGADVSNPLNTSMKLMEYNWYLDNMDLENAKECINSLIPYMDRIMPLYVNEINIERMFLELVGDCNRDFIDNLYDKNLKKYIKASKFMIGKKRFLMAYEAFYNEDKDKALEYYEEIKRLAKKYPIKADADMEIMLVDWVKDKININI